MTAFMTPEGRLDSAAIDAALIAEGHDPACVTYVCREHRRHCHRIGEPHETHACFWCDWGTR